MIATAINFNNSMQLLSWLHNRHLVATIDHSDFMYKLCHCSVLEIIKLYLFKKENKANNGIKALN